MENGEKERARGKNLKKSIVADLPVSCPLSCVNIFGRHRVDAGKRVGVCDCPVCQPQSIRHLSVRARVSHAHVIPHARVHSARAPLFALFAFFCRRRSVEKKRGASPRETMPMPVLSVESREANDRGVSEKLIASWSDTERSKCRPLIRRRGEEDG